MIPAFSLSFLNPKRTDEIPYKSDYAIVIVKKGDQLAGLMVDGFIGQKEIVIKPLGNYLGDVFVF